MTKNLKEAVRLINNNESSLFDLHALVAELLLLQECLKVLDQYKLTPVYINGEARYLAMEFLNGKKLSVNLDEKSDSFYIRSVF